MTAYPDRSALDTDARVAERVFAGGGALRARCRALDWAATPLGAVDTWPQSLRTAAATALGAGFPTALVWGPDLVQLYNDAFVPLLGAKDPAALGQPTQACWPEVWDINAPIYARVRAGETVTREDACYPVRRGGPDGPTEDLYVTISYSPVPDESGAVGGVLITAFDTTAAVRGRVAQAEEARREAEARAATLAAVIDSIPDAVLVVGPEGVTLANPAALDQLGVPTVEALRTATPPEALPLAAELLDRATGAPVAPEALPFGRALRGERSHATSCSARGARPGPTGPSRPAPCGRRPRRSSGRTARSWARWRSSRTCPACRRPSPSGTACSPSGPASGRSSTPCSSRCPPACSSSRPRRAARSR
jgi:PAS domain-containing protein